METFEKERPNLGAEVPVDQIETLLGPVPRDRLLVELTHPNQGYTKTKVVFGI